MNGNTPLTIDDLFTHWQNEDRDLERYLDDLRDWMNDVSKLGIPKFGETADRLARLETKLMSHFTRENEIVAQLGEHYRDDCSELTAIGRQTERDHRQLAARLENLIARLDQLDPPFRSWEAAINEVEAFMVSLERHEERESDSVMMLMPRGRADATGRVWRAPW
jgi:iron-sulfur cluster repair protein YtfE (RIC family)